MYGMVADRWEGRTRFLAKIYQVKSSGQGIYCQKGREAECILTNLRRPRLR